MDFIPPRNRYRLYFDETGNGDLNAAATQPNERYLSITGVVIRQDWHDGYSTRRLQKLKNDIFGEEVGSTLCLHRRDIMRREGPYAVLRNDALKIEFDARLLAISAETIQASFTVSIDKLEHLTKYTVWRYSPYHYVLVCLIERYIKWLENGDFFGDVMGEARSPTHDQHLRRSYKNFYLHGNEFNDSVRIQRRLTTGDLKLVNKAANIAGVQIADILAHPAHRALKFLHLGETLPDDFGAQIARVLERRSYDRSPAGKIEGYGRKWLP